MPAKTSTLLRWGKRFLVYLCGLFIMAVGVIFSVKSGLGVSPVTSLANVSYQILGVSRGLGFFTLGSCTTLVYCIYILVELLILRRDFQPTMLLQVVASTIFGFLVTLAGRVLAVLPAPEPYALRLIYLACSIPLVAFGVMLYLAPNILPTPGEGLSIAISKKLRRSVAGCKMLSDCCMVACAAALSLFYFGGLVGVREGTVLSALLVGLVMKRLMRVCNPFLLRFVERETPAPEAVAAAAAPGLIITISREAGSGGYAIGQALAEKLGIPFYDRQLEALEAEESGLDPAFIRAHEQRMARSSLVYDFLTSGYAMYHAELPPLERLFQAQGAVLRRIAASGESCVIMGRCADFHLYGQPQVLRVHIHAPPAFRIRRLMAHNGCSEEQAHRELTQTDRARARYYAQFAARPWGDTRFYHLSLDSSAFDIDGCVSLILDSMDNRKPLS